MLFLGTDSEDPLKRNITELGKKFRKQLELLISRAQIGRSKIGYDLKQIRSLYLSLATSRPFYSILAPYKYWLHLMMAGIIIVSGNPTAYAYSIHSWDKPATELTAIDFSTYQEQEREENGLFSDEQFLNKPIVVKTQIGTVEKELNKKRSIAKQSLALANRDNLYPYGYCTWWAKLKRPDLPNNLGNAGNWLRSADRLGFSTGQTPRPGALVVTTESWWGHVGYIEAIGTDGTMTVSDMNLEGWSKVSQRQLSPKSKVIKGYIY